MTRPIIDRRHMILGGAALAAAATGLMALPGQNAGGLAHAQDTTDRLIGDVPIGPEDAPVTVIEYASLTCPHCADFHRDTWPQVKADYVETGKVRFVMREVYFDRFGLWASMVARCAGPEGYHAMIDAFLKRQDDWTRADDIVEAIRKVGRLHGLSTAQIDACMTDRPFAEALVADYQKNADADGIQSTPSFLINGELHRGNMGFDEFSALIEAHL